MYVDKFMACMAGALGISGNRTGWLVPGGAHEGNHHGVEKRIAHHPLLLVEIIMTKEIMCSDSRTN